MGKSPAGRAPSGRVRKSQEDSVARMSGTAFEEGLGAEGHVSKALVRNLVFLLLREALREDSEQRNDLIRFGLEASCGRGA